MRSFFKRKIRVEFLLKNNAPRVHSRKTLSNEG